MGAFNEISGDADLYIQWGRLVALWLCYFQGLGFSMSLTMVSSNVAGYTKKQLTGALLFTGYCVGNIIGPQTFISSEARKHPCFPFFSLYRRGD